MENTIRIMKRTGLSIIILIVLFIVGVFGYITYLSSPTEVRMQVAQGPNTALTELVDIAEKGIPINSDPYASSTYRPEDTLYESMYLIQNGFREKAKKLLAVLANQGNIEAMFWMGELTYKNEGDTGADFFQKAAELGNPYAALMLDEDNVKCQENMTDHCDSKWGELGKPILIKRAAEGDAKAGFALYITLQLNDPSFGYFFDSEYKMKGQGPFQVLLKAAKDGVKQNYYKPFLELLHLYQHRRSLLPFNETKIPLTEAELKVLDKIIEIAVNNNDINIMAELSLATRKNYQRAMERIAPFVDRTEFSFLYDYYGAMALEDFDYAVQGYARAIAYEERYLTSVQYKRIFEFRLRSFNNKKSFYLTEEQKSQAQILTKEYLKQDRPIIYIDENQVDSYYGF